MIETRRRPTPPTSLETTTRYDGEDVRRALEADFHGKCYLCEGPTGGTFNIEHLRPKAESTGFPELRQSWPNLFPAHGQSCNQRRVKWHARPEADEVDGRALNWPCGGLVDCAAPAARVEWRLVQWGDFGSVATCKVFFEPRDPTDRAALNTAIELRHIHGDDDRERHGRTIRERIAARYADIQKRLNPLIRYYYTAGPDALETRRHMASLAAMLAPTTPYAAVLRGTLRRELARDGFEPAFLRALGLELSPPP